ncbi:hypothetical protein SAMN05444972_107125 [Marininema halotolerans]|uniref:Uncharacterized protein n=1 Tax=Marininema halotolerans TaxID=1155944 RepID=A0A1I6SJ30_9BACL|nr:hypothetical protein SAMN05444972_107125 [Marininema halotolerans]
MPGIQQTQQSNLLWILVLILLTSGGSSAD